MTETQLESYFKILPKLGRLQKQVLDLLAWHSVRGLTCSEVEEMLPMKHQTASARLKELLDKDIIRVDGTAWDAESKRNVRVYKVKPEILKTLPIEL